MRLGLKSNSRKVLRDFAGSCLSPGEEAWQDEVALLFTAANGGNLASGLDYLWRRDLRPLLPGLKTPPTIIQGDRDPIVPAEQAQFLHEHLSGSRLVIMPDAGHILFWTQAGRFNGILEEILRED
jgi:pimeloyl-ACP methyl ester carboxylesterase